MADKRTLAKRNGKVKLVRSMITKGQGIMAGSETSRNPKKEIAVLMKNVQSKKISIDELNENILNAVEPEEIEKELEDSTNLDLLIDTEIEIMSEFLGKLHVNDNIVPSDEERRSPAVSAPARASGGIDEQRERERIQYADDDNKSVLSSIPGRSSSVVSITALVSWKT